MLVIEVELETIQCLNFTPSSDSTNRINANVRVKLGIFRCRRNVRWHSVVMEP
jgi:hypothetical protein